MTHYSHPIFRCVYAPTSKLIARVGVSQSVMKLMLCAFALLKNAATMAAMVVNFLIVSMFKYLVKKFLS